LNITTEELNYKNFNINLITFKKEFVKDFNIDFLINNNYIKEILYNNKEKFQFLNLLFNLIECIIYKDKKFNTPISFDATCSGYQHLSGLFRDIELAYHSNVINPKQYNELKVNNINLIDDNQKDLYSEVGKSVEKIICDMDEGPTKDKFLKLIIDRGLLKIVAMLLSYNSGLDKMKEQIISQGFFEERIEFSKTNKKLIFYIVNKKIIKEEKEFIHLNFKEMGQFVGVLFSGVRKTFPSLSLYINYMKNISYVLSSLNLTIE
jgi:DNA-directed RNA polymerase